MPSTSHSEELRFDRHFPIRRWLDLYSSALYNEWWTERNAEAARAYAYLIVTSWIDDTMIGTLSVWSDGLNSAWIDDVVVHPDYRHAGVGSRLVEAATQRLSESVKLVQVSPIPGTEAFYERLGFVVQPAATVMELPPSTGA